jgi:hypothetical protein
MLPYKLMKNYNFQRTITLFLCAIFLIYLGITTDLQAEVISTGRYSNAFMSDGAGARAAAMGGSYVSLSNDAWSIFWNPAGLLKAPSRNAGLMHSERFEGVVDFDAISVSFPQKDGSILAAGMLRLGVNGIPFTKKENDDLAIGDNNRVLVDKVVNEGEYVLFVSRAFTNRFGNWGITPKAIFKNIGTEHYSFGLGFDAGFQKRLFKSIPIDAGVAVRDFGGSLLIWDTGHKEIITSTVVVGLSGLIRIKALDAKITPTVDLIYRTEVIGDSDAGELRAGIEYLVRDFFALRFGSKDESLTFGGGMNFKPVSVDYAYAGHDDLGDTHRVSVSIRWASWK